MQSFLGYYFFYLVCIISEITISIYILTVKGFNSGVISKVG